jgi:hypothetical protein
MRAFTSRPLIILLGFVTTVACLSLYNNETGATTHQISIDEMSRVKGLGGVPCQHGVIDWGTMHWECFGWNTFNDCDNLSCVSGPGPCPPSNEQAGNWIPSYTIAGTSCQYYLDASESRDCYRAVECKHGDEQTNSSCHPGTVDYINDHPLNYAEGCKTFIIDPPVTCSTCTKGDPIYGGGVMKVYPIMKDCPTCQPET